jgi:hypothetical protein
MRTIPLSTFSRYALGTILLLSCVPVAHADFVPPGFISLPDDGTGPGGLSEADFEAVLNELEAAYQPIVQSFGGTLVIERRWTDNMENASASRQGNSWIVTMYGGLARNSKITKDAYTLIACHELGHHLGGFVFKEKWSAAEGQSDYFAALSCTERLWKDDVEENARFRLTVDPKPKDMCDRAYGGPLEQNLCYRVMTAGFWSASSIAGSRPVSFDTPDDYETNVTNVWHPTAQCRLDTFVQAALCSLDYDPAVIPQTEEESSAFTCMTARGFDTGARPRCWFAPSL